MKTITIKTHKGDNGIVTTLKKNIIKDMCNYTIITFSTKHQIELSHHIYDTYRKAINQYKKETYKIIFNYN